MSSKRVLTTMLVIVAFAIGVTTYFGPSDASLGGNLRLVLLHGVWVWAGKLFFAAAAIAGIFGLILPQTHWSTYCAAIGLTALFLWLTYLPMSLIVQVQNWGGIFWDEPRWKVPLMFGIVALLLQLGLLLIRNKTITNIANIIFGALIWWKLGNIQNVLHPQDPVFSSDSVTIRIYFIALMALALLFASLLARLLKIILQQRE